MATSDLIGLIGTAGWWWSNAGAIEESIEQNQVKAIEGSTGK
jgi:hypothetical protein